MSAEIPRRTRRSTTMGRSALIRVGSNILGMAALGIFFGQPHRYLPPTVRIGGTGFCMASLMFFAAAALRHCVLGGEALEAVFVSSALSYAVLLLVSIAKWLPEFTLYLCISIGIDLVASCLAMTGIIELNGAPTSIFFLAWQLAAVFSALVQWRLGCLPDRTT
jgi:hypothetical protein